MEFTKADELDLYSSDAEMALDKWMRSYNEGINELNAKEKKSNEELVLLMNILKQKNIISGAVKGLQEDFKKLLILNEKNAN